MTEGQTSQFRCFAGPQLPSSGPLPIGLLRAASLLLLLPDCMAQGPPILKKAFAGGPLEKFKATLAFAVSILHRGVSLIIVLLS